MKNVMNWVCRIFTGIMGLIFFIQGFIWAFFPDMNLTAYDIQASSVLGINMIKSDIGAGLFASSIFTFLFLFKGKQWFFPLLIIAVAYLAIRLISLLTDGYHQTILFGVILESLFLISISVLNHLSKSKS